ncbi:autotransporter outer membrane beta-barrel domain-containing protein [Citrobacter gillenii]|uniref:autotransporter outer membrane beta-barrel domain-containing protein n=1 Tax=Citrobacter gillenii TaxID=67828 RepID=UPI00398706E3
MNKVYSIIWNAVLGIWVVVSELTKGKKKSSSRKAVAVLVATTLLSTSPLVMAGNTGNHDISVDYKNIAIQPGTKDNIHNDGFLYQNTTNGEVLNVTGALPKIEQGQSGLVESATIEQLLEQKKITLTANIGGVSTPITEVEDLKKYYYNQPTTIPSQDDKITVIDPALQTQAAMQVYNTDELVRYLTETPLDGKMLNTYDATLSNIYNNFGIAQASDGATANLNIGNDQKNARDAENTIKLLAKNSALLEASGTGSKVNWISDNYISFGAAPVVPNETFNGSQKMDQFGKVLTIDTYGYDSNGDAVKTGTQEFDITNTQELGDLNEWLLGESDTTVLNSQGQKVSQLQLMLDANRGTMSLKDVEDWYAKLISSVLKSDTVTGSVDWQYQVWKDGKSHTNNATIGNTELHAVYAHGAGATGTVTKESVLAVDGSINGVMKGTDGAVITNQGSLNALRTSTGHSLAIGMLAENATATNAGTINSGLFIDKDKRQAVNSYGAIGMQGKGTSTVTNDGVINQAITTGNYGTASAANPWDTDTTVPMPITLAIGMLLSGDSTGVNNKTINVVDGDANGTSFGDGTAYGVEVAENANFTNSTGATIYLGRDGSNTAQDVELTGGSNLSAGIHARGAGTVNNEGKITLGTGVRNAAGLLVAGASGNVINSGEISVNGATSGLPNYGMSVHNSGANAVQTIRNDGQINVNGKNNIGIHVRADSSDAKITTSQAGQITVNGEDGTNERNYAIWVEGASGKQAIADISSGITLKGAGDIGVHVRGSATANINNDSSPVFNSTDQIGYFLYGSNAVANIGKTEMNDNGQINTTIFRVAEGAKFAGNSNDPQTGNTSNLKLTLNGQNSIGVFGTGKQTQVETGKATFNVGGTGSSAILIEGGATGIISDKTTINLTGVGTIAGIVDGQAHNLNGSTQGKAVETTLTSNAKITSETGGNEVIAYVARNLGNLTLGANAIIDLSSTDSIGVDVQQGGRFTNNSDKALHVSDGIGVQASGASAQINKLGQILVDDGTAGVLLTEGASLLINGISGDSITTNGSADGIRLADKAGALSAQSVMIRADGTGAGIQNDANNNNILLRNVTIDSNDGAGIRTSVALTMTDLYSEGNILNVHGKGTGFAFEQRDGGKTEGNLTIGQGYTINVLNGEGSGIRANTDGVLTTNADINVRDSAGGSAIIAKNVLAVSNSGKIISASTSAPVIDASGDSNKKITNTGTLQAINDTAIAIQSGKGNDAIDISGGVTSGVINTGEGTDTFNWQSGTFAGEVNFAGTGSNNKASIGNVTLDKTRHIITAAGTGNALTFTNTHGDSAKIGSLNSDNQTTGTNIGTGWNSLTITGSNADVRVVENLSLASKTIAVNDGATLRTGDHVESTSTAATIGNYDVETQGTSSRVIFDAQGDTSAAQIYDGVISGDGKFERKAGGTTVFTNNNSYTGSTTIDQTGTLQLGSGGDTGEISAVSNILDNGVLAINRANNVLLGGVISGIGALQQIGGGITRLAGNNTYTGDTTVTHGTLLVNGNQSAATGATTVSGMSTLGGNGTIGGNVLMNDASTLSAGDGGAGTLTINGGLQLGSKTTSAFELGQAYTPGGALNDLITVTGNLQLDGTLDVTTSQGGNFGPGVYRIYNYGGTLDNRTLELGAVPDSQDKSNIFVQTSIDKQVNLVNANGVTLQFWDGATVNQSHGKSGIEGDSKIDGGDGKWMAIGDQGDNNWTTATGEGNAPWAQKSFAVFTTKGGTVTVDDAKGDVNFSGAQFDADGYVVKGDALNAYATTETATHAGQTPGTGELLLRVGAGGAGQNYTATIESILREASARDRLTLVKTDLGRLILSGDNEYRGGTRIDGGTLQISADSNLGQSGTDLVINNASTLQLGADLTSNRTIELGANANAAVFDLNSHHFTPTGDITGDGKLKVTSSSSDAGSTLTLDRANSYQGETEIAGTGNSNNVTVNVSKTGAFGSNESSTVNVTNGATLNINGADTSLTSLTMNIADSLLTLADTVTAASANLNLTGKAKAVLRDKTTAANATVNVAKDSTLALEDNASGGNATVNNSGLMTAADNAMAENTVVKNLADGLVDVSAVNSATSIGSLSGAGNVELGNKQLSLGNLNLADTISGVISGNDGSLVKIGDGTLTLTGDNTWTGITDVDQGVLLVNGNQSAATGQVTVKTGATLGGNGIIGGAVDVQDNGHITAGAAINSVGKLTTGSLTLSDNAQLDYQFGQAYTPGGAFNDLIDVNGDLTLDGKLNIETSPNGSFDVGVYRVINYTGTLTNNVMDIANAPEAADSLYVQTSVKNQVNLVNHAGLTLRFWDGTGGENGNLKNNGVINGGDGIWQSSQGNDNWTTDESTPEGALNAPFTDAAFAVFQGEAGNVTVDNSKGDVIISGAQFATDGYRVGGEAITTDTANTLIRVGDGTVDGVNYTATIDSVIRGTGGLNKGDLGTLILTGDNTYSGGTTITSGTLQVAGDTNLGAADTDITFNGGTLKYGDAFDTARQVTLESGGGTFDTNGHDVSLLTEVEGHGQLIKTGKGSLTLTLDNTYTGGTTINQGVLQLGTGGDIGSIQGDIVDNGVLSVNRADTLALTGDISGKGQLHQTGNGTTELQGKNSYSGATLITHGVLQAGDTNTLSAASHHYVVADTTLNTQGYNQTVAGLSNGGDVSLIGQQIGTTLTVKGDYTGEKGTINMAATQNGRGAGIADRLIIDGGKASGKTLLDVDGSGLGAPTVGDGIEVVTALNGATTTAQTSRDAFHLAAERMAAGAFEYQLHAGNAQGQGENWYLRSEYRPETMLYSGLASIVRQGDISLLGNMHQRMGDEVKPGIDEDNRAWARMIGYSGKTKLDDATGTQTNSHTMGIQVGVDMYANESWKAGMYASVLDIDSSVKGTKTGSDGKGGNIDDNAFYVGGYATWFSDDGMYVDNVLQYGNHKSRLSASGNNGSHTVKGNTLTASTEVGKSFRLGASAWSLEPQAQLIYQYSNFDNSTLDGVTQTKVKMDTADSFTARLGVRLVADYDTNHGKFQPYGRVNVWQGLGSKDKTQFSNAVATTTLESSQQYSSTEVAAGLSWSIDRNVQVYGELGTQFSNGSSKSQIEAPVNASIGFKKSF